MKSRLLALFAGGLTLALGYWLAESSRDAREIWLTVGAWVLGFWFASNLLGAPRVAEASEDGDEMADEDTEEYDEEYEEDYDEEDEDEYEEEKS